MPRQITPATTLDNLRKEAKRWLRALREKDSEALERIRRAWPKAPDNPVLRDVQHALACEYGAASWKDLRHALEARPETQAPLVTPFLEYACPGHHRRSRPAHPIARHAA